MLEVSGYISGNISIPVGSSGPESLDCGAWGGFGDGACGGGYRLKSNDLHDRGERLVLFLFCF